MSILGGTAFTVAIGPLLVLYVLDVLIDFELIFIFLNCAFEKIVTRISIGLLVFFFYMCEALECSDSKSLRTDLRRVPQ